MDHVEDPYRYGDRIEKVVRHWAGLRPDAIAVQQGASALSYGELVELADRIAAGLWATGVRAGDCVPVRMERGVDLVAVLLGVLRLDAAYIALDPAWPDERAQYIAESSRATTMVHARDVDRWRTSPPATLPDPPTDGRRPACVFYTSGSTGQPKGALSPHRGTVRILVDNPTIPLDSDTVFFQAAPLPWDGLSLELWAPLLNGGRCVLLDQGRRAMDVDAMEAAIACGVNSMWLTSSLFNVLVEECLPLFERLRLLLVGGERVSPSHVRRVLDAAPGLRVVNGYGPAENTIFTTTHVVRRSDVDSGADVPIGRPAPCTCVVLLDENGDGVPDGVVGELVTAGDGLAIGYLGDPEETARRFFVRDGRRYYRTGDLAVADEEGNLRFRGRVDRQVKVRGVRIEPSEVESAIERHPDVLSAHVVRVPGRDDASAFLGCLYTSTDGRPIEPAGLREFLECHVIEAMRPGKIIHVAQFPLTANGKVDDAAVLKALAGDGLDSESQDIGLREPLVEDLRQLFDLPQLGSDTDLLLAGVTSLNAVRLAARISSHTGRRVTVADVYRSRTLEQLLRSVSAGAPRPDAPLNRFAQRAGLASLSHAQQRFWLAEMARPGLADNVVMLAYELVGDLDVPALRAALNDAVRGSAILRTVYPETDELPTSRVIAAADAELLVEETSVAALDGRSLQEIAEHVCGDWWATPIRIDEELPVRARLCRLDENRFLLCLHVHHIAFDGWSELAFIERVRTQYSARLAGTDPGPEPGPDYLAYTHWEQQQLDGWRAAQVPFWRQTLSAVPPPFLPEPSGPTDAARKEVLHRIGPAAVRRLTAAAAHAGVPLAAVFTAGVARAIARTFAVDDICVGTVTNGRSDEGLEDLIGYLVNPLALPLFGIRTAATADLLTQVGTRMINALEHAQIPFDELVRILGAPRGRHPWFQVWSVLQAAPPSGRLNDGVTIQAVRVRPPRTAIELMFEAIPQPDGGWLVVQLRRADGIDQVTAELLIDELAHAIDEF